MPIDPSLRWRLRRGMKELDVLLERYLARRYESASGGERGAFEKLLDEEDPHLWQWLMGHAPIPPEFEHVITQIRRHD